MNSKQVWTILGSLGLGFVFFGIVMGAAMGLVMFNANASPDPVWFPLPVAAILFGAIRFANSLKQLGAKKIDTSFRGPALKCTRQIRDCSAIVSPPHVRERPVK